MPSSNHQDDESLERIREDLLRRARSERRSGDIEEALPPVESPLPPLELQARPKKAIWPFSSLFAMPRTLINRTGSSPSSRTDTEMEGPKTPDLARHFSLRRPTHPERSSHPSSERVHSERPSQPSPPPESHQSNPREARSLNTTPRSDSSRRPRRSEREEGRRRAAQETARREPPKRFLLCFPWVKSSRTRKHVLQCFVSGTFLAILLAIYLGLAVSNRITNGELTILLIMIILFSVIFFSYSLLRLCLSVLRGDRRRSPTDHVPGYGGYAVPNEPIHVVLARDEEAVGVASEATKTTPPAYGLWRESVRVDPDRFFWQRNEAASDPMPTAAVQSGPRPPSYVSEDGVAYVLEAAPRSVAPTVDVPLPTHPSERGRLDATHLP